MTTQKSLNLCMVVSFHLSYFIFDCKVVKLNGMYFRMVIRIRCDAKVAQCQLGMKFGCDPVKEAPKLLSLACSIGVQVVGVSFHVGSGCGEVGVFRRAIAAARNIFDLATDLGFDFNILDIGGGYPGGHGTSIEPVSAFVYRKNVKLLKPLTLPCAIFSIPNFC